MNTLIITLLLAFLIVVIALGLLGIGWLLTGKSKIRPGACGRDPRKIRDEESCGQSSSCSLCEKPKDSQKQEPKKH